MPAAKAFVPKYCRHKAKNMAYVRLPGEGVIYLGEYDSPESHAKYDQLISAWMANGRQPARAAAPTGGQVGSADSTASRTWAYTVGEFARDYLLHAKSRYARHGTFYSIRAALRPMVKLFKDTPLADYGPKRLIQTRRHFIQEGLVRREVNRRVHWIRNAVRWAVAQELVPGEVVYRLDAVEGLRRGEENVRESAKVRPVDNALVEATLSHLSPEVAAMVRVQLLTGARSGEVCVMRAADIDMSGDVWLYKPMSHKTESRGFDRVIAIGPRAQEVLRPFLTGDPNAFLFSPANVMARMREASRKNQGVQARGAGRLGAKRNGTPRKEPRDRYCAASYGRAITTATRKAFPLPEHLDRKSIVPSGRKKKARLETQQEWWGRLTVEQREEVKAWWKQHHWHPHQLRHTCGTKVREEYGLDGSAATLGHASVAATQVYAELRRAKAVEIMKKVG